MIFDRFYKVDRARTRDSNSSGLGLSIVRKIIEVHGGTVEATSTVGEGTTFTVTLPLL
ncbi:Sensor protein SrrB [compost metagenome]